MKKILILFALLGLTSVMTAQKSALKAGPAIFINPNLPTTGIGVGIGLERRIGNKFSFNGQLDYTVGNVNTTDYINVSNGFFLPISYKSKAILFNSTFRYYPKESMKGFFLGLGAAIGSFDAGYLLNTKPYPIIIGNSGFLGLGISSGLNININPKVGIEINGSCLRGSHTDDDGLIFLFPININIAYLID